MKNNHHGYKSTCRTAGAFPHLTEWTWSAQWLNAIKHFPLLPCWLGKLGEQLDRNKPRSVTPEIDCTLFLFSYRPRSPMFRVYIGDLLNGNKYNNKHTHTDTYIGAEPGQTKPLFRLTGLQLSKCCRLSDQMGGRESGKKIDLWLPFGLFHQLRNQ